MDIKEIEKFAKLARINISEGEKKELLGDMESILDYISLIKSVPTNSVKDAQTSLVNCFREDEEPHTTGIHTEKLLDSAPLREGGYIKVKKIL